MEAFRFTERGNILVILEVIFCNGLRSILKCWTLARLEVGIFVDDVPLVCTLLELI